MNQLQLFYTYKFNSSRLKKYNYDISIDIQEALKNGELVSIGDNQVLRTIRKITRHDYSKENLENIKKELKKLKKMKYSIQNVKNIKKTQSKLDKILHITEYVSVIMDNVKHYEKIIQNGLFINGIKYVRLLCAAGHARKNMVMFCTEEIEQKLKIILKNGIQNIDIAHAKYNAYFALYSSSTHEVPRPRACVIPDCVIKRKELVDWVEEYDNGDTVTEKEVELEFNLWDGMGIISPEFARKWSEHLGIKDYEVSAFAIRSSFVKGMVCVIDFHKFAKEIAKTKRLIEDVWGNEIKNVYDYDIILTESQFKLWKAYSSWSKYEEQCIKNDLSWGVSKVTPKIENKYCYTNYQFIQACNFDDNDIKELCSTTVNWFNDILGNNVYKTMLFLNQNNFTFDRFSFKNFNNVIVKALMLNHDIIHDKYINDKIYHQIQTKIKQSFVGKLVIDGNFQVMISDPFALCEYMFGMKIQGLLKRNEYYCHYWNDIDVDKVSAMRAPLTAMSEVNTLDLINNNYTKEWFKYLNSGVVYNVHGNDCMIHADSDFDFDIVMSTSNKQFVNKSFGGLPITYKKNMTDKIPISENDLYKSDINAFNTKIGFITNHSTSMYTMLSDYEKDSVEYIELMRRLRICRKEQGSAIDQGKGIIVKEFPKCWIYRQEISEDDSEEIKNKKEFDNKLIVNRKPYFMRYIYNKLNKDYNKYHRGKSVYCEAKFNLTIDELKQKKILTQDQKEFLEVYYKYSPVNESNSIMNKICKYMEDVKKELNITKVINRDIFNYEILMSNKYTINSKSKHYKKVLELINQFTEDKKSFRENAINNNTFDKNKFDIIFYNDINEIYNVYKNKMIEIFDNLLYLTDLVVYICYNQNKDKDFVWGVCSEWLLQNIHKNPIIVPIKDDNGDIKYLGEKYSLQEVNIDEDFK